MDEVMSKKFAEIERRLADKQCEDNGMADPEDYQSGEGFGDCCPPKDCGPCRETAQTMLRLQIERLRRRADGLEALLNSIGEDFAYPAEEALWSLLQNQRAGPDY